MDVKTEQLTTQLSETAAFSALKKHFEDIKSENFCALRQTESRLSTDFVVSLDSLVFYYNNNLITEKTLGLFEALLMEQQCDRHLRALFTGKPVNVSENQAALHTAYRGHPLTPAPIARQVAAEKSRLQSVAEKLIATGVTHCIHIGIGGSDLGPQLLYDTLKAQQAPQLIVHYLSSLDYQALSEIWAQCPPDRTAVIVASKSFSTTESIMNAEATAQWLKSHQAFKWQHWFAVTAATDKAQQFGIPNENILTIPNWVGGRWSLWSSMALSIVAAFSYQAYERFLAGGMSIDKHVLSAPLAQNIPKLMACLGVWYRNFWARQSHVIAPYSCAMNKLVPYCQQLEMESLGKSCTADSQQRLKLASGPAIWGGVGPEFQHAFGQSLHQGTCWSSIDFIVPVCSLTKAGETHQKMIVANAISQAATLFKGAADQNRAKQLTGNRPSNTVFMKQQDAFHLGALIALYEHKVFIQSVIWGLNPFDQFGVEWGKQLARKITHASPQQEDPLDAVTKGMLLSIQGLQEN